MQVRLAATIASSCWLAIVFTTASLAQTRPQPTRTLEDLLLEAEKMVDQQPPHKALPENPDARREPANPQHVIDEMRRLVEERNRIVDRSALFATLRQLRGEERRFFQLAQAVNVATRNAKQAANQLNIVAGMARGAGNGGPGPVAAQLAAAQAALNNASAVLNNATAEAQNFYNAELQPRYQRVGPALPRFFENYSQMRKLIPLDRQNPAQSHLLAELQRDMQHSDDFVEGHILTGILHAYSGDNTAAQAAFIRASDINESAGLAFTPLGYDCCYGLLLAGKPEDIPLGYVSVLKKLDPKRQTSAVCWLVGAHAFARSQYNEASKFLYKAFTKADKAASPQLRGEVAWVYLFAENKQDIEKALELLEGLDAASAWQVKRAKAGVAAGQGAFPQAIALMEGCRASAPPHFDEELNAQQKSYSSGQIWLRSAPANEK